MTRVCEHCGGVVKLRWPADRRRFCSMSCAQSARWGESGDQRRRRPVHTFICANCGEDFEGKPPRKFCSRECASCYRVGANNHAYRGGICIDATGRAHIRCIDGSVVAFARAVVEAELRRPLRSKEIVHHRNGDHTDDRPDNLQVVTRAEHIGLHRDDLQVAA